MLIPRFSLRWLLGVITASSVFFLVLSLAVRGSHWAMAVGVAVGSLLLIFLTYGIVFLGAWLISLLLASSQRRQSHTSPFATDTLPPQLVAPEEPES